MVSISTVPCLTLFLLKELTQIPLLSIHFMWILWNQNPTYQTKIYTSFLYKTYRKKSEIWPRRTLGRNWEHWADIWDIWRNSANFLPRYWGEALKIWKKITKIIVRLTRGRKKGRKKLNKQTNKENLKK